MRKVDFLIVIVILLCVHGIEGEATYSVVQYFDNQLLMDDYGYSYYDDPAFAYDVCMNLEKIPNGNYSASLLFVFQNKNVLGQLGIYFHGSAEPVFKSDYIDEQTYDVDLMSMDDGPMVNWNSSMVDLGIFTCTVLSTRPISVITFEMKAEEFYDSAIGKNEILYFLFFFNKIFTFYFHSGFVSRFK
jgi:hypothetical protein